jgi:hypothetical protein
MGSDQISDSMDASTDTYGFLLSDYSIAATPLPRFGAWYSTYFKVALKIMALRMRKAIYLT